VMICIFHLRDVLLLCLMCVVKISPMRIDVLRGCIHLDMSIDVFSLIVQYCADCIFDRKKSFRGRIIILYGKIHILMWHNLVFVILEFCYCFDFY
jgi:hypothetical protein